MKQNEWANDPGYLEWAERMAQEARDAQDKEMERQHRVKGEAWLKKTQDEGLDPC